MIANREQEQAPVPPDASQPARLATTSWRHNSRARRSLRAEKPYWAPGKSGPQGSSSASRTLFRSHSPTGATIDRCCRHARAALPDSVRSLRCSLRLLGDSLERVRQSEEERLRTNFEESAFATALLRNRVKTFDVWVDNLGEPAVTIEFGSKTSFLRRRPTRSAFPWERHQRPADASS